MVNIMQSKSITKLESNHKNVLFVTKSGLSKNILTKKIWVVYESTDSISVGTRVGADYKGMIMIMITITP